MRAREMHFAAGTIATKKSGFRGWALALARLEIRRALRLRRRLHAVPNLLCSLAFSPPRSILPVLGLTFLPTADGLPIPLAGSPSPPPSGYGPALGAAVPSLGTCGKKVFLAALEQTQPLPRLTCCPLTGSRLTASLMWAQGSCELPTAKPRTRGPTCPAPRRPNNRSALLTEVAPPAYGRMVRRTIGQRCRASSPLPRHHTAANPSPRKSYRQRPLLTATPFGMYVKLCRHRDQFVVIDDVDALYADRSGVRLLTCLCQTGEEKAVAWHTDARSLEPQGIPRSSRPAAGS